MKQHISDKKLWLLIVALILILLGITFFSTNQTQNQPSMIDIDPFFVGPAACSGEVTQLTVNDVVVDPYVWHGRNIWVVENGLEYEVSWTANADVLGLAEDQCGVSTFTAGTDGFVNHPAIAVSYTMQEGWLNGLVGFFIVNFNLSKRILI